MATVPRGKIAHQLRLLAARKLVRFGKQKKLRHVAKPGDELLIERRHRMGRVPDDHTSGHARRLQVVGNERAPGVSHRLRHTRVSIAGKVTETALFSQAEEVDRL